MIWGAHPYFWKHPYPSPHQRMVWVFGPLGTFDSTRQGWKEMDEWMKIQDSPGGCFNGSMDGSMDVSMDENFGVAWLTLKHFWRNHQVCLPLWFQGRWFAMTRLSGHLTWCWVEGLRLGFLFKGVPQWVPVPDIGGWSTMTINLILMSWTFWIVY